MTPNRKNKYRRTERARTGGQETSGSQERKRNLITFLIHTDIPTCTHKSNRSEYSVSYKSLIILDKNRRIYVTLGLVINL